APRPPRSASDAGIGETTSAWTRNIPRSAAAAPAISSAPARPGGWHDRALRCAGARALAADRPARDRDRPGHEGPRRRAVRARRQPLRGALLQPRAGAQPRRGVLLPCRRGRLATMVLRRAGPRGLGLHRVDDAAPPRADAVL